MAAESVVYAVLGGIVLLGAAIKSTPTIWRGWKAVGRFPEAAENLAKISTVADLVYAEFSANDGSSMRDAVNRLEASTTAIVEWQATHTAEDLAQNLAVQTKIAEVLDLIIERTTVTPEGGTVTEPLSIYTQDRMHDLINSIAGVVGHIPLIHERLKRLEQMLTEPTKEENP